MTLDQLLGVTLRTSDVASRLGFEFLVSTLGLPKAAPSGSLALDDLRPGLLPQIAGALERPLLHAPRDRHGRIQPDGLVHDPIVDRLAADGLDAIRKAFEQRGSPLVRKWPWRNGRPFGVALSHDVDLHMKWRFPTLISQAARGRSLEGIRSRLRGDPDPWWTYDEILDLERRSGVRSTFFFAAGGRHSDDPSYRIEARRMRDLVRRLSDSGWQIGLHGSYLAAEDGELLSREKSRFERATGSPVDTYRQHFLRVLPLSIRRIQQAGFRFDSSLGTEYSLGFLTGTSMPHSLGGLLELPVSLMDTCFQPQSDIHEAYTTPESRSGAIREVISNVRDVNGMVVADWHQNYFAEDAYRTLYDTILHETQPADRGGVRDLALWWHQRNEATLSSDGTVWTLSGDGLEPGFTVGVSNGDLRSTDAFDTSVVGHENLFTFRNRGPWKFAVD